MEPPPISAARSEDIEIVTVSPLIEDTSYHDYYWDAAAQYALDHAEKINYNPNYPDYDDDVHGDCTNFVSQAIYEGGNASLEIPSPLPLQAILVMERKGGTF
jgi:hypothetical protein